MRKQINDAWEWGKPTVSEVEALAKKAAAKMGIPEKKWLDVGLLVGVKPRNFRRWREGIKTDPNMESSITFAGYGALYAMAYGKPLVKPVLSDSEGVIASQYITNAENYVCPPRKLLEAVIGVDSLMGLSRAAIGQKIGIHGNVLAYQITTEKISFSSWAQILMLCSVPVSDIFYRA